MRRLKWLYTGCYWLVLTNKKSFSSVLAVGFCPKNLAFSRKIMVLPESLGLHAAPLSTLAGTPMSAAGRATKCSCTQSIPYPIPSHSFFPLFPSSVPSLSFPSFAFLSLPLFHSRAAGGRKGGGRTSAPLGSATGSWTCL